MKKRERRTCERIVAGLENKSRIMNEQERTTVAYHESGHALVAELLPHADPVAKVSIVPHGRGALGYTMQMPTEDRYLLTREELKDHRSALESVARQLLETETVDGAVVKQALGISDSSLSSSEKG